MDRSLYQRVKLMYNTFVVIGLSLSALPVRSGFGQEITHGNTVLT